MEKIKGISFTIDNSELHKLEIMPEYYTLIRLHSIKGQTKSNVHYPLKHPPASFNSWQQLGRVMVIINRIFETAEFEEVQAIGSYSYTLKEFASYFNAYVEMPKPYYPQNKNDYMRHLVLYAQRLHFKGLLNHALMNAIGFKFNVFIGSVYQPKEVYKKVASVMKLDRSEWKVQKGKHSNKESSLKRKQLKQDKIEIIASHINDFTNSKGKLDVSSLSSHLGISKRTIYRLLKQIDSYGSHITNPNGTNTESLALDSKKVSTILQTQMAQNEKEVA